MQIFARKKKKCGFTLIELLVVIAIIGILAGIVLVSLGRAPAKARDAQRMADIRQVALAMEMYHTDEGTYKTTTVDTLTCCAGGACRLVAGLVIEDYLEPFPTDPGGGGVANCNDDKGATYVGFDNSANTSNYCIFACLDTTGEFFAASKKGTTTLPAAPTSLDCW